MPKPCKGCGLEKPRVGRIRYCSPRCQIISKRVITGNGCWISTDKPGAEGYGVFYANGTTRYLHRESWKIFRGPIPRKHDVHHKCHNRRCFNPAHLKIVSKAEHGAISSERRERLKLRPLHC